MTEFNFDEWSELFESNPAEFERRRTQLLEEEILKVPAANRSRLRLLQIECDGIRQSMHPLDAAAEMTQMTVDKLRELKTPLTQLRSVCEDICYPE